MGSKEWIWDFENCVINKGNILEAFVGQELLAYAPPSQTPNLYYWSREERGHQAEVDYLFVHNSNVIPLEVKAGHHRQYRQSKSLKVFLGEKKQSPMGIQVSPMNFSIQNIFKTEEKQIIHLPFYFLPSLLA
jgi:hypothetical protein